MRKDKNIVKLEHPIANVADYITAVNTLIRSNSSENRIFVFRGEPQRHDTYCTPNIFRKNVLSANTFYEKSLFNAMRQNNLSNNISYLENAIDAQHGEFPSRLLDVSYNCLNALYFAVTPCYHFAEDSLDYEDGMIYIFYVDEIFSPSAQNTNENYNAIINKNYPWFNGQVIFEKNHKFIDHTKINNRIIAQQGAFILFQGDDAASIPSFMMSGIVIPKEAKARIRNELSLMFGINTGTIYPEIVNLATDISNKSKMLVTEEFSWENELKYVLKNLEKELSYYLDYLNYLFGFYRDRYSEYCEAVQMVEMIIDSYRVGLIKFYKDAKNIQDIKMNVKWEDILKNNIFQFNSIVEDFRQNMQILCATDISKDLKIEGEF